MKTRITSIFIALIAFSFVAFAQTTQDRRVESFDKISSYTSFDVVLKKGNTHTVTIEAQNIDPDKILTDVKDGTLKVTMEEGEYKDVKATLYITYSKLEAISLFGSGNIDCESSISTDNLSINLQGSGDISLKSIQTAEVSASIKGSGDIYLAGNTEKVTLSVKGSGDIEAADLEATDANVRIQGSGDVELHALNALSASIMGSGDVRYKGEPKRKILMERGSGNVSKM